MESALLFDGFRNLEDSMNLDSYFAGGFRNFLIVAAITAVIYFIIWFSIEKKIDTFNKRYPDRAVSLPFVSSAVRVAYFAIAFLVIAYQVLAFRPVISVILDAGGIFALCVAIAARESFNNYIAGFLLTVHKPFNIGDKINIEQLNITGIVKNVTFRHTAIKTVSGSIVTIPNSIMNTVAIEDLDVETE